ncbi:MAG: translation initiation factor [Muribaculaceae bacterium]|nr:translation initiation factor [Muribaculaceae bacterium]
MQDWKDKLGAAFGIETNDTTESLTPSEEKPASAVEQQNSQVVHVMLDKKGRHGKQTTLVTDLMCDDATLKELARELKQLCGVGGSARGGEILIQGDKRETISKYLREKGFKVK